MIQALDGGPPIGANVARLRRAARLTQERLAETAGISVDLVKRLEQGTRSSARITSLQAIAQALGVPLTALLEGGTPAGRPMVVMPAQADARVVGESGLIEWVAEHSELDVRAVCDQVLGRITQLQRMPEPECLDRAWSRGRVTREQLVTALAAYYPAPMPAGSGLYQVRVDGASLATTVLTRPGWLNTPHRLDSEAVQFRLVPPSVAPVATPHLEGGALAAAIERLAAAQLSGTVLANAPVYRLAQLRFDRERLEATVALADFAEYALTVDLLESELLDALAGLQATGPTAVASRLALPLRDAYLPSASDTLDTERRICAGGPITLTAIARPAGRSGRRRPDYALLVQERSSRVVNATGRLAVIPKAFHQPMVEPAAEADLSASLLRELDEELLGRKELGKIGPEGWRRADPLHADLVSAPLRWLLQHPDAFQTECVGFGINLLSGNYEFATLAVIDDQAWWEQFSSQVEANWEAERIRLYSSRDTAGLRDLMADPRWSNEGLFALTQGLRRLAELGPADRVAIPQIDVGPHHG